MPNTLIQQDARAQRDALVAALQILLAAPGIDIATLAADLDALAAFDVTDGPGYGAAIAAVFNDYVTALLAVPAPAAPTGNTELTSRGVWPVKDPSQGLASFAAYGPLAPASPSGAAAQSVQNRQALIDVVSGVATAALASLWAQTDFVSSDDADAARTQLLALIDTRIDAAAAITDDTLGAAWQQLYGSSANDLTVRGKQLPQLVAYSVGAPIPALALANRLYPDRMIAGDTEAEDIDALAVNLVARNKACHPLFMPMTGEALSAP